MIKKILFLPALFLILILSLIALIFMVIEAMLQFVSSNITKLLQKMNDYFYPKKEDISEYTEVKCG